MLKTPHLNSVVPPHVANGPQTLELKADTVGGAALPGQLVCKTPGKLALDSADQIS